MSGMIRITVLSCIITEISGFGYLQARLAPDCFACSRLGCFIQTNQSLPNKLSKTFQYGTLPLSSNSVEQCARGLTRKLKDMSSNPDGNFKFFTFPKIFETYFMVKYCKI